MGAASNELLLGFTPADGAVGAVTGAADEGGMRGRGLTELDAPGLEGLEVLEVTAATDSAEEDGDGSATRGWYRMENDGEFCLCVRGDGCCFIKTLDDGGIVAVGVVEEGEAVGTAAGCLEDVATAFTCLEEPAMAFGCLDGPAIGGEELLLLLACLDEPAALDG